MLSKKGCVSKLTNGCANYREFQYYFDGIGVKLLFVHFEAFLFFWGGHFKASFYFFLSFLKRLYFFIYREFQYYFDGIGRKPLSSKWDLDFSRLDLRAKWRVFVEPKFCWRPKFARQKWFFGRFNSKFRQCSLIGQHAGVADFCCHNNCDPGDGVEYVNSGSAPMVCQNDFWLLASTFHTGNGQ